jgi:hypothetical protein
VKDIDSFATLSERLGVTLCTDCSQYNHDRGAADISKGVVHWHERRVVRKTLRRYLKLLGAIVHSHNRGQPIWQQLYEQNQFAHETATKIRIRIPSVFADEDRAKAEAAAVRARVDIEPHILKWMHRRKR